MPKFLKLMTLASFVAISSTAIAQDSETPKPQNDASQATTEAAAPNVETAAEASTETATENATGETPEELSMGENVVDQNAIGSTYIAEQFDAWQLRCVRVADGQKEPCHLFQLMKDPEGNAVAEINLVSLTNGGQAVAGATVVVPVETLLTKQLTLSVDGGAKKRYPFRFCSQIGCYSQIGLSNADIASYKRGVAASLSIVPAFAPNQTITVELSLSGFTKAYETLKTRTAK
ncbi:hypothetical protein JI58_06155 [Marinosulfonomonas sp. PRT-SC04]|nr:hypothetical protein JI58_06155 [Marinosulfonomonas sp. PRT-SC04]